MSAPDRRNIANDLALFSEHLSDTQPRRVKTPPPPSPTPPTPAPPNPVPVVRTLKPPPEIWELVPVNEVKAVDSPSRFSLSWSHPFIVAVVAGLLGAGVYYFWMLGSPQKDPKPTPVTQTASAPQAAPQQDQTTSSQAEVAAPANQTATSPVAKPQSATPELNSTAAAHTATGNPAPTKEASKTADVKSATGLNPTASLSGLGLKKKETKKTEAAAAGATVSDTQPASSQKAVVDTPAEPRSTTETSTTDRTVKTAPVATDKSPDEKSASAADNEKKGSTDTAAPKPKSNAGATQPPSAAPAKPEETPKPKVIKWP